MEDLSALLLRLYSTARQTPSGEFQDAALALIQPLASFTSAAWGSGRLTGDGIVHHTSHLVGEPPDRLIDYEEIKHLDNAAFVVGKNLGRAIRFHAPTLYQERKYLGIREYARRWKHDNYILASRFVNDSGLLQWVGVYRSNDDRQYCEAERQCIEILLPHLVEALRINLALSLREGSAAPAKGAAIVDRFGIVHQADRVFLEFMRAEWPTFRHVALPQALVDCLQNASDSVYVGSEIAIAIRHVRDLILLKARRKAPVDDLSGRQLAVAKLVAEGLNHKEISRRLQISPTTVRNYIQAIHERLGVRTNVQLSNQLRTAEF